MTENNEDIRLNDVFKLLVSKDNCIYNNLDSGICENSRFGDRCEYRIDNNLCEYKKEVKQIIPILDKVMKKYEENKEV